MDGALLIFDEQRCNMIESQNLLCLLLKFIQYPSKYSFGVRAMKSAIDLATERMYTRRQVYQLCGRDSNCTDHTSMQSAGNDGTIFI